jgi:arylsulfatase
LHAWATDKDDATVDPKFGKVGKQRIEDTGPLTRKRMETIDQEVTAETLKWLDKNGKSDKPFFYGTTQLPSMFGRIPPKNMFRWL